jgi:hypothetical protein
VQQLRSTMLSRFPVELINGILKHLDVIDGTALALTCKTLLSIALVEPSSLIVPDRGKHTIPRPIIHHSARVERVLRQLGPTEDKLRLCFGCLKYRPRNFLYWGLYDTDEEFRAIYDWAVKTCLCSTRPWSTSWSKRCEVNHHCPTCAKGRKS